MNSARFKLVLACLWIVPAFGFLTLEWAGGTVLALPLGERKIPLAWIFLLFGAFNLLRWWASPATKSAGPRRRMARRPERDVPDENFRFDNDRANDAP
jgi:hypothetical protein